MRSQRAVATAALEYPVRELAQVGVDQPHEAVPRLRIAGERGCEQLRDLTGLTHVFKHPLRRAEF